MAVFNLGFVVFDIICGGKVNPNFRAAARAGAGKVKKQSRNQYLLEGRVENLLW